MFPIAWIFSKNSYLAHFNEFDIILKFISFALITLEFFFFTFLDRSCNFRLWLYFRIYYKMDFSHVVDQIKSMFEWTISAFLSSCLYKTIKTHLVIDDLNPILFFNGLLQNRLFLMLSSLMTHLRFDMSPLL